MRALFVAMPMISHAIPLVPLATAMRDAGHEVLVVTGGDALSVRAAGLAVHDVAPGFRFRPHVLRIVARHPLIGRAELAGEGDNRGTGLIFGALNTRIADDVVAAARGFAPDLVLYEPLIPAGAIAAAHLGVPAVLHGSAPFDGTEQVRLVCARMTRALQRYGLDALPPDAATLTVAPPSLVGPRPGWPIRHVPHGSGSLPEALATRPDRPRILVTRSTLGGLHTGAPMHAVVAAAPAVDAEFLLVRPGRQITRADTLPPNVRTVDWVPFSAVLGTCSAVVHHGGGGTVLSALAAGLPQLVIPGVGDRRYNADVVAARGAGLAMPAGKITAEVLTRLVTDPAMAASAQEVRDEIAAMPPPAELVARLAALARSPHQTKEPTWHTAC
jgi:UDP:flavonoid glycosyltransferase YjiC (YdhE family)